MVLLIRIGSYIVIRVSVTLRKCSIELSILHCDSGYGTFPVLVYLSFFRYDLFAEYALDGCQMLILLFIVVVLSRY
jgi:hypothetical protein